MQGGSVTAAQPLNHAVDAGNVVVGGADELEQAFQRVLPQHPGTCNPHDEMLQYQKASKSASQVLQNLTWGPAAAPWHLCLP